MTQLSHRITQLQESQTILMAQKSRELKAKGVQVIDLSLGEPDFQTPKYICDAAIRAVQEGYHHYPPVPGYPELRKAISDRFIQSNGLNYQPDQIVVSTGAKQTLANIMMSVLNPGDEVLVPIPFWVSYAAQIQLAEGKMIPISSSIESDFKITPDQLEAAITENSRIFLFSSPCNPTGSVYSKEELEGLVAVLRKHPYILVVSDEIYEHIHFSGRHESIGALEGMIDRTVTVNGLSKGFAMTGWRLGYMGAPLPIAKACTKMQGQFTSGANAVTQQAAITAIMGDLTPTLEMRDAFHKRRDAFIEALSPISGLELNKPDGAFYLFPRVNHYFGTSTGDRKITDAEDLCMYLLEVAHVSTVTGEAFGAPDYMRLSYANSMENLLEAAQRIAAALSKLS